MIDGIPYRIETIGFYCYLNNPLLAYAGIRLPLKDLIEMRSFPYDKKYPWVPCKEGDCFAGKIEKLIEEEIKSKL